MNDSFLLFVLLFRPRGAKKKYKQQKLTVNNKNNK